MMEFRVVLLLALATGSWGMTVSLKEAEELPEELKPIMPGGSWFDDMAVKRLHMKHHELKEHGKLEGHKHEDDPEEMFIMSRLTGAPHTITIPEIGSPVTISPLHKQQDNREVMRNFLRHHTHHDHDHDHSDEDDEDDSSKQSVSSHEFMEVYERELENFFKNFMSAMMQAEVGGVRIETRDADRPNTVASD